MKSTLILIALVTLVGSATQATLAQAQDTLLGVGLERPEPVSKIPAATDRPTVIAVSPTESGTSGRLVIENLKVGIFAGVTVDDIVRRGTELGLSVEVEKFGGVIVKRYRLEATGAREPLMKYSRYLIRLCR